MIKMHFKGNGFKKLAKALKALSGPAAQKAYATALNEVGPVAKNKVVAAVKKQVGGRMNNATIQKRGGISTRAAYPGRLDYVIGGKGGHLLLKDFQPVQGAKGVRAGPWGRRLLFQGAFIQRTKLGGHVFHRTEDGRFPIKNMFGPAIPKEMVKGKSKEVFETYVAQRLPKRLAHQVKRATRGVFD